MDLPPETGRGLGGTAAVLYRIVHGARGGMPDARGIHDPQPACLCLNR
jgi:hypothetical protein